MKLYKMLLLLISAGLSSSSIAQTTILTAEEKAGIAFMREEEKLARDVYDSMYSKWNTNPFGNIRQSERHHMSEMKKLISIYDLEDPVARMNDKPGSFENSLLKKFYDELITRGSSSLSEAMKAGAFIEEIDLRDLKEQKAKTGNSAIIEVYDYLIMATENHLRAFNRRLSSLGVKYEPVLLSTEDFKKIIESENKMCGACNTP